MKCETTQQDQQPFINETRGNLINNPSGQGENPPAFLEINLPYHPPYDWETSMRFLGARTIPGVEEVSSGRYRRTVCFGDTSGILEVFPDAPENQITVRLSANLRDYREQIMARVTRMFDLNAEPQMIAAALGMDPDLQPIMRAHTGLRIPGAWDGFEVAMRAILGQQISVQAARTLAGRLVKIYGDPLASEPSAGLNVIFPDPKRLVSASLAEIGLPQKRRETIRFFAGAVLEGRINLSVLPPLENFVANLVTLPGIGPWTAHYIAMRLGEADAFPSGDLGLRRALSKAGQPALSEKELVKRGEAWRPWRAYAVFYLWHKEIKPSQTR